MRKYTKTRFTLKQYFLPLLLILTLLFVAPYSFASIAEDMAHNVSINSPNASQQLTSDFEIYAGAPLYQTHISTGAILFHSDRDGDFEIYTFPGLINLTNNTYPDTQPEWSPDGSRIAYIGNVTGSHTEVWVMDADGSNQEQLTSTVSTTWHSSPAWSPNGSQIVYVEGPVGTNAEIWVMDADGSNKTMLSNANGDNHGPQWTTDGRIAFTQRVGSSVDNDIYTMNPDGSNQTILINSAFRDANPDFSPDGTKMVFESERDGNIEIYIANADGSNQQRLTTNSADDIVPTWSADSSKIVFTSNRDGNYNIYIMDTDGSNVEPLISDPSNDNVADWNPVAPSVACFIDTPSSVNENDPFTATVTCNDVSDVYGFEYDLNIDPSSPTLFPQATAFTAGNIFNGLSTLILINNLDDGYAVSLQGEAAGVSGNMTLGSIGYDTDDPGTVILTLDDFLLGNINGQEITVSVSPSTQITILDLQLASFEGSAKREAGLDLTAAITVLADSEAPDTTGSTGGYFTFAYDEETVSTDATLEIGAPGHLSCLTSDMSLPDDTHTVLDPITLLAGDVNGDGSIDLTDASIIVSVRAGDTVDPSYVYDLDEDGRISILDLIHVGRNYGSVVESCIP